MTLKLIVENDKNELSVHAFTGDLITAGRAENNDLCLPERNISRHHLQLEAVDGRITIEDSGSYNSTFVNGREILKKMEIFVGDVITVGDYNIYLEQDDEDAQKSTRETLPSVQKATEEILLAKNGPNGGRVFPIKGVETVLGSHAGADVYIYGPDIPEVHSKIIFDGNIYLLIKGDLGKKYPLIVNGMEINSVDIRHGDEIKIVDYIFEYIEKGNEYDPQPYLMKAQEERKNKLRDDFNEKKIKSFHEEEEEVTEVTKKTPKPQKSAMPSKSIMIGVFVAIAIILALVIFFTGGKHG